MDYADWDMYTASGSSKTGCQGPGYDLNVNGGIDNLIPISSSVTKYCKWAVVASSGQSLTINSCSDSTDPRYTGAKSNVAAPKNTYYIKY